MQENLSRPGRIEVETSRLVYHFPVSNPPHVFQSSLAVPANAAPPDSPSSPQLKLLGRRAAAWLSQHQFRLQSIVLAEQVHGAEVQYINSPGIVPGCDGFYTDQRDLPLLIRTADCAAVFALLPGLPAIGIAHAGWRGTAAGIVPRLLQRMAEHWGASATDFHISVSPHIRTCCYEVGEEFYRHFPDSYLEVRRGKIYFDLTSVIRDQILQTGVPPRQMLLSDLCTCCGKLPLFSYRCQNSTERLVHIASL